LAASDHRSDAANSARPSAQPFVIDDRASGSDPVNAKAELRDSIPM